MLIGYIFYCYNFVVIDYVRPYLVSELHFSVSQTAIISSAGTVGITVGALCWAEIIARLGRRRAAGAIAAAIGATAAIQAASGVFVTWAGARMLLAAALGGYYVVATGLVVALFPAGARGKLIAVNSAMYPTSNILVAAVGAAVGDAHWHILLWLGALPLPLSLILLLAIPRDDRYRAFDDTGPTQSAGSWREMLGPRWRWLTLGCVLLSGIDFNAYQLFFSFVTLYLKQVREASAGTMGLVIAVISAGSLIGTFAWAVIADRFGRRLPATGYLLSGAAILVFLYGGLGSQALVVPGFVFGFGLSCTTAWGVWFAEMFPLNLRPYGVALFQAGHILSIGAPLFAAFASERVGLIGAMSLAPLVYVAGAALWARLPETLGRPAPTEALSPL
ncbi:MAG: MFS transporter [Caulobacteraceae bacterium]|nr:MFS transporter [Caulobacteraceae bacterium]